MKSIKKISGLDGKLAHQATIEMGGLEVTRTVENQREVCEFLGVPMPGPNPPCVTNPARRQFQERQFLWLAFETCGRTKELHKALWEDVDLDRRTWFIPIAASKNGRPRVVPLTADAVDIFKELKMMADPLEPRVFDGLPSLAVLPKHLASLIPGMYPQCRNLIELRKLAKTKMRKHCRYLCDAQFYLIIDSGWPPTKNKYLCPGRKVA